MSHDRGCPCGREKYEYEDCPRKDCMRHDTWLETIDGRVEYKFEDNLKMKEKNNNEFKFDTADDFGFSTMELSAIRAIPEVTADYKDNIGKALTTASKAEQKVKDMFDAIQPLLQNLLKDADKNPYIHWPNRAEKIQQFIAKLVAIKNRD